MLTILTITLFFAALLYASFKGPQGAWAQLQIEGVHVTNADLRQAIGGERRIERRLRDAKCIPQRGYRWRYVDQIPRDRLKSVLSWQQTTTHRIRKAANRCAQIHHLSLWLCVHDHEGSWTDPDDPYFGGLQMGRWFMGTYGARLYATKGTADNWTPREQMAVADRAYHRAGHSSAWLNGQWPGTRSECGA